MGDISQYVTPLIDPGGVSTLGGLGTSQRVLGRLKEEGDILPILVLPTLTKKIAQREDVPGMDDGTIMVQGDHSMDLENQNILPHRRNLPHMVEGGGKSYIHWPNSEGFGWVIASYGRLTSKNFNLYLSMSSYRRGTRNMLEAYRCLTFA